MSNTIRNNLTIYGPADEAGRFLKQFVDGGMAAFVPIPPNATIDQVKDIWGALPENAWDVQVLPQGSITMVNNPSSNKMRPHTSSGAPWLNRRGFSLVHHGIEMKSQDLPGFLGRDKIPIALLVFHTKWDLPRRWIEFVINSEYERGVVLIMESFDITSFTMLNNIELDTPEKYFVYTSDPQSKWIQSGHCAAIIKMPDGDGGDDFFLPQIDEEGKDGENL
ncbi:MAG: hypothetical protein ABSC08_20095 [Bryobacteraceae bacterium]|jgi:hypothetical protein